MAFLPGYDMELARMMVAGADVWLNTPLPPLEASGHQRHEGGAERRAEPERAGRLVDRGWKEGVTGWAVGRGRRSALGPRRPPLRASSRGRAAALHRRRTRRAWMMKQAISRIGGASTASG